MIRIISIMLALALMLSLLSCADDGAAVTDTSDADTDAVINTEDTTAEDTTAEDTTAEDTTAEDTTAEDTTAEDTIAEDTTAEDTTVEDTTAHEHSYTASVTAPTCTYDGYTTHTCYCGDSYTDGKTAALGHSWGEWETTKAPTESETGTAERSCSVCGEKEVKALDKLDSGSDAEINVFINENNFPDEVFREYVRLNCDPNSDGVLSADELAAVTVLDLSDWIAPDDIGVEDITGIEYFTALEEFYIVFSNFPEIDLSCFPELTVFLCKYNAGLTSLDFSHNTKLKELDCTECDYLTELDITACTELEHIECDGTDLEELDLKSCTKLTYLYCSLTKISELDLSSNTALNYIFCDYTPITVLDVSNNKELIQIVCGADVNIIGAGADVTIYRY